jgi:hypothetical protein
MPTKSQLEDQVKVLEKRLEEKQGVIDAAAARENAAMMADEAEGNVVEEFTARVEDLQSQLDAKEERLEEVVGLKGVEDAPAPTILLEESLPHKIVKWLEISSGKKFSVANITRCEVRQNSVSYVLKDRDMKSEQTYGILTKTPFSSELQDPPVHEHDMRIRQFGEDPRCACGKSESDLVPAVDSSSEETSESDE